MKKGDKLIISSNQPVSFYNQPVCNHQKVRSTTLSRYVIRTSSKGRLIISTFILVVQFDNTIRFATLESVRPGLTAKGSFKNSKSKGRSLFIHHLCEIFHFIVKCVTGKCNMTAVIQQLFFPSFFPCCMLQLCFSAFFQNSVSYEKNAHCRAGLRV